MMPARNQNLAQLGSGASQAPTSKLIWASRELISVDRSHLSTTNGNGGRMMRYLQIELYMINPSCQGAVTFSSDSLAVPTYYPHHHHPPCISSQQHSFSP